MTDTIPPPRKISLWRRVSTAHMIGTPIMIAWVSQYVHQASPYRLSSRTLAMGPVVIVAVSLVYLGMPFFTERLFKRHPEHLLARGKDPDEVILLINLGCSVMPCMLAFFLALAGGSIAHVYLWSSVSFLSGLFWALRYRHVLFNRPRGYCTGAVGQQEGEMSTEGVSAPYDAGTHFTLHHRFGAFPVAPLLRALGDNLEPGSVIKFVTLVDPHLRAFLKTHGLVVWRFPWRHDAEVCVSRGSTRLTELVAVAEAHQVTGLAVWFLAYDVAGNLLLEAEDGNDYLWLTDHLPQAQKERLMQAVGGAASKIDHVASTC